MELEGALAAPSTAQSSSESTATFGRKSSGSGGNDDANVPTLTPINELLDRRPLAVPATSSGTERGRQERKDRSNRSSSTKTSSTPVMIKTITKSPTTGRSNDGKSKSPRSNRGSVKGSARESTPRRSNDQDPEAALEKLIAEGAGSTSDQMPMLDDRPGLTPTTLTTAMSLMGSI